MLVDPSVVERAQSGDDSAFNELVQAYRKRILGTVSRLIGRPDDVEDVGQEVFLRLYDSMSQLRSPDMFEPWLYRLTVNAAYDYLRKQKRKKESRLSDLSEAQVMLADADASSKLSREDERQGFVRELVHRLLDSVSKEDKLLLLMKEVEGLSMKELEKVYGINENAVKVRLFRARQRVLKAFAKEEESSAKGQGGSL